MAKATGRKLFAHLAQSVEELRAWVKEMLSENEDPKPSFVELCELSNHILSLAKELTSLAVLLTRAAQESHSKRKNW
jgi:hypothetical protein